MSDIGGLGRARQEGTAVMRVSDYDARVTVRRVVHDLAERAGARMIPRPWVHEGTEMPSGMTDEPEPLAGIRAAITVERVARVQCRNSARYAREDGRTWQDIGEAMGFADDPQPGMTSVAEHAFRRLASDLGGGASFTWKCPACRQLITDRGPELAPHDAEHGHGDGCARFAADAAAWDDEEGDGG